MHKNWVAEHFSEGVSKIKSAFKYRIVFYRLSTHEHPTEIEPYLASLQDKVLYLIRDLFNTYNAVKINFELFGMYVRKIKNPTHKDGSANARSEVEEELEERQEKSFNYKFQVVSEPLI